VITALATELVAKGPTGEAAKSGPWGLAIILILCAACYFLFKSMSKHMRKVRDEFPVQGKQPESPAQQGDPAPAEPEQAGPDQTHQTHQTHEAHQVRPKGSSDDGPRPANGTDGPAQA
jgi:ABC-type nickel/cobalt efflux system permease component RcnA